MECAITAVPDEIRGQIVKATVVLTRDYAPSDELVAELPDHVRKLTIPPMS
jgi:acetyl-CoA synthetase